MNTIAMIPARYAATRFPAKLMQAKPQQMRGIGMTGIERQNIPVSTGRLFDLPRLVLLHCRFQRLGDLLFFGHELNNPPANFSRENAGQCRCTPSARPRKACLVRVQRGGPWLVLKIGRRPSPARRRENRRTDLPRFEISDLKFRPFAPRP